MSIEQFFAGALLVLIVVAFVQGFRYAWREDHRCRDDYS